MKLSGIFCTAFLFMNACAPSVMTTPETALPSDAKENIPIAVRASVTERIKQALDVIAVKEHNIPAHRGCLTRETSWSSSDNSYDISLLWKCLDMYKSIKMILLGWKLEAETALKTKPFQENNRCKTKEECNKVIELLDAKLNAVATIETYIKSKNHYASNDQEKTSLENPTATDEPSDEWSEANS